ncbi:MAG: response regulator transcription factor [Ruminiclostridium sp.]|nr:response regulator transcription factor [Ruminiclostridium sp.]
MTDVLIVDDERMVQELFAHYIASAADRYRLVGTVRDASNAVVACLSSNVDLVLMDICTANNESGIAAASAIKQKCPHIKIIMVTSAPEVSFLRKSREAGADSFWYKEVSPEQLITVMDRTMAGEHIYPDDTPTVPMGEADSKEFTETELRVLSYIVQGKSINEISQIMQVEYETTRTHIKHLKEKTGAASVTALCALAVRTRLIMPEY